MSNTRFISSDATIKWITFSDGLETCQISGEPSNHISVDIKEGTRDVIRILLLNDALKRMGVKDIKLTLKYFPQARADRVFDTGNPLPVKVFADMINSCNFSKVYVYDPHSDVTPALINNISVIPQEDVVFNRLHEITDLLGEQFTIVAPDLGATKKIFNIVKALGHKNYIQAVKIRDVTTGNIVKCDLQCDEVSGNVLIVDDICDGGNSFIHLARLLKERGASKVGLFVTHGIFAKGLSVLEKDIDFIFCSNIVCDYVNTRNIQDFNNR